jgi:hypothetical protein
MYDNIVLSHKDRRRIIGDPSEWAAASSQFDSVFGKGSVLVDGFVSAGWRIDREAAGRATLVVMPVRDITPAEGRELETESLAMLAFAAPDAGDHDVRIEGLPT